MDVIITLCYIFFFSSRRRHTRSKRDWSSDVCSSDLDERLAAAALFRAKSQVEEVRSGREALVFTEMPYQVNKARSEERRVGKESRTTSPPWEYSRKDTKRSSAQASKYKKHTAT